MSNLVVVLRKIAKFGAYVVGACALALLALFAYNTIFIESKQPHESAPRTTEFVDIDGETLAYREWNGDGGVVLIIGGLSSWAGTWERVVNAQRALGSTRTFVVLDLPLFGYSTPDGKRGYMRDVQASRIAQFVSTRGYDNVHLVAHSYGAGPSMEYAFKESAHIASATLIDPVLNVGIEKRDGPGWFMRVPGLRHFLIGLLVHNDTFALSRLKSFVYVTDYIDEELLATYSRYFDTDGLTDRFAGWIYDYVADPLQYASTETDSYRTIHFPVSLIWGEEDTLTPIEEADVLLEHIPGVKMYRLSGVGHIPMIENYTLFDTTLFQALAN